MDDLLMVDCQNDFIDGSLACLHAKEAVRYLISFADSHDVRAFYTADWHSPQNGSFRENGGIWPVHCVAGTRGAEISSVLSEMAKEENRPCEGNIFLKGRRDDVEEYSGFGGETANGTKLSDVLSAHVFVGGIASEYCVRETVLSLLASGRRVTLLAAGLGYVGKDAHDASLTDLAARGVRVLP